MDNCLRGNILNWASYVFTSCIFLKFKSTFVPNATYWNVNIADDISPNQQNIKSKYQEQMSACLGYTDL